MPVQDLTNQETHIEHARSVWPSLKRGLAGNCPSCGEGKIFSSGLTIVDECSVCHEELHHHRADDLPAYLNIFIVGHVVVALTMIVLDMKIMGMWSLIIAACILAIVLAIVLMRPLKGMVVGTQWALKMHGFGGHDE